MQWREGEERLHYCPGFTEQCTHNTQFCGLWVPSTLQTASAGCQTWTFEHVQKHISFYVTRTETCKWKDLILMKIVPLLLMFILNTKPRILIYYRFFSDKHIQPNGHYSYCHFLFLDKYVRNMRLPREPVFIR